MKHNIMTTLLLAASLFTACSSEELVPDAQGSLDIESKGLVIKAGCLTTKTDISEGKSSWEAGDEVTVVYDGKAYSYIASVSGAVTDLVSENGIENFDSSKPVAAYYPATDAEGTVAVPAERTIEFLGEDQVNAAHAPLVGIPSSEKLENGVLKMGFRNICSVIELRIDAGGLVSPAKSLTIAPASEEGYEGYVTFTGTVDASTLAVTPSVQGNELKLVFPDGTDLTKPQTVKFPVGRFTSASGLSVTLETADGKTYKRNIYKSGIKTYNESEGNWSVMHLAKAMYAFAEVKGISSAADLVDFAAAVNSGADLGPYMVDGAATLLNDIDVTGVEWIPIGNPSETASLAYNTSKELPGSCAGIVFDGGGHSISNLAMAVDIKTTQVMGLFGAIKNSVVRNLRLEDASLTISGSGISASSVACGLVAGVNYGSTIENVSVNGTVTGSAKSTSARNVAIGGICGLALTLDASSPAKFITCRTSGKIDVDIAEKYSNTNTVVVAGIAGAVSGGGADVVTFENCTNGAAIDVKSYRAAGIVGNAYKTKATDCTNVADIICSHSADKVSSSVSGVRMGGIMAYSSNQSGDGSIFTNCINTGTVATVEPESAAGGICGLIKCMTLSGCKSSGNIICPEGKRGLLVGTISASTNPSVFAGCGVKGAVASAMDLSDAVAANAMNYMELAGNLASDAVCETFNAENIVLLESDPVPGKGIATAEDLVGFAEAVNAGDEEALSAFYDGDFIVNLLADIDCSSIDEWIPVGTAEKPFTGHFQGNGHAIKNLSMVSSGTETVYGLFGIVGAGAIIENFMLDSGCSMTIKPAQPINSGVVAGSVSDAVIMDITSYAAIAFKESTISAANKRSTIGMVGNLVSGDVSPVVEGLVNYGSVTVEENVNTESGANCVHAAGIVAFANGKADVPAIVRKCINYGDLNTTVARVSGIIAGPNSYCTITDCVNRGNVFNKHKKAGAGRLGNIACNLGNCVTLANCINYGDIVSASSDRCGGICGNIGSASAVLSGCENYGRIVSDEKTYRGTICGYFAQNIKVDSCIAQGDVGEYNGGTWSMAGVNSDNYFSHIGAVKAGCEYVTPLNIWWSADSINAGDEFGVEPGNVTFAYTGGTFLVSLSCKTWNWTTVPSEDWLSVVDESGNVKMSGTMSATVQRLYVRADINPTTSVRTGSVTFSSADGTQSATVSVSQASATATTASKWVFTSTGTGKFTDYWTSGSHIIPATDGTSGIISAVRGEANASVPFNYSVSSGKPYVGTLVKDDCLMFSFPVENIGAGTWFQFNTIIGSKTNAHKYYILEYLDGGQWKSVPENLRTASEDASLKYTFMVSGMQSGADYQHASVFQLFRLDNAISSGTLKVRLRAVGTYTCSGVAESTSNSTAEIFIPAFGFSGAYCCKIGDSAPKTEKRVLALGNSFSYYNNPLWYLQEIAVKEGNFVELSGHVKGSQNLAQHASLTLSTEVVSQGHYDYAFLQDQSENPAKYASTGDASILNAAVALADNVRSYSPSCRVVLENTWSFNGKAGSYGGTLETFDNCLASGTKAMASAASAWVSPIGQAFARCRELYPSVKLYHTDNKHQSAYGAYLKACVNYLVMFGEKFGTAPADCGLDPAAAANLRAIAEEIVLGHEQDYLITR